MEYLYKFVANEYGYKPTAGDINYVNDFFMSIDVNGDNKVTEQEFMEAYKMGKADGFLGGLAAIASGQMKN